MPRLVAEICFLYFGISISVSDIRNRIIRNLSLLKFFTTSLLIFIITSRSINFWVLLFALASTPIFYAIFSGKIGAGDVKLFIVLSIWCRDINQWLEYFALSWILGGLFAILQLRRKSPLKQRIAFAPFIFLAFFAAI